MAEPLEISVESDAEAEPRLTEEQGWDLLMSMRGMLTGAFEEYGGSEAWLRQLREDDEDPTR